jgi:tRNA modification GTPase
MVSMHQMRIPHEDNAVTSIYALSSGHGKAGVAVIRISGPRTGFALHAMAGGLPKPRVAWLAAIRNPETGDVLDRGLVLWFPAPRSFTGEDMAELHVHGGRAVLEAVLRALAGLTGLRLAEPGDFARRAFENGKLDLTAAEGLADLIDAETEAQRRQALRQADGALRSLYDGWRERLIAASAMLEAELDFADEADVPESIAATARPAVETLARELAAHLQDARGGEILRDGFHVVIAGPPNAGKSSLLNALARRDAAIVSAEAGTTRDVIEVRLDLGGYPVVLMDTAGIREAGGEIEREGIRRTLDRMRGADLVLWMQDASLPSPSSVAHPEPEGARPAIRIASKSDLATGRPQGDAVPISAKTGEGLDRLLDMLLDHMRSRIASAEGAAITRARHRAGLTEAHAALLDFIGGDANAIELRAEDLRRAATAIGRITGRVDVEDILDKIFADFCIGK